MSDTTTKKPAKKPAFQRARQPAQKAQRRQAVLEAAAALLEEGGLEAVNLAAIAGRAGVVKSNLYRYYESREEILVRLLVADLEDICLAMERSAAARSGFDGGGRDDLALIAHGLAAEFAARPRLCLLTSVLASTLERNLSEDTIYDLKRDIMATAVRMTNTLHAAAPALGPEACTAAGHTIFALVAGLWPMANPAPQVEAAMKRLHFDAFCGHFARDLESAIHALLAGHLALKG